MLIGSLTTLETSASLDDGLAQLWEHPQVRSELLELLDLLPGRASTTCTRRSSIADVPLAVHARYTRAEILAAFDIGTGAKARSWREGVLWDEASNTDLFAFTLDKSAGSFSPTTRYRDYAISPELIHWESQSGTSLDSPTGRRYISQAESGTNVVLFARLNTARSSVLVPRPGDLRLARRRTPDRDHLAAAPSSARRPLRRVRRRSRLDRRLPGYAMQAATTGR